jgi:PAS domain S-box-containing protein
LRQERTRLLGSSLGLFIAEEGRLIFADFLEKVFTSKTSKVCEVALLKEGSAPLYVQVKGVVAESGEECRLALIDLTERKQAEDKLRENEARYRALFESGMDAFFLSDSDGSISSANPEACAMFQMTEEELCRVGRAGIINLADPRLQSAVNTRTALGKVRCELTAVRKDGTIFPVEVSSVFFDDACHSFVVLRDLTKDKRAEEDMREKERLLMQQSRLAAMGEMVNNIAHQWRQPLNALGLVIQGLKLSYDYDEITGEVLDQSVGTSMKLVHQMSQTIEDFRNYFKPDKEKVEYTIQDAVARTVSLVGDSLKYQQIAIEIHGSANPTLVGFPNEFSQVLLNIIMNAKDALLERHHDDAKVIITIGKEGERSVVTIADNGGGIPEEIKGKVFEPYFTTKGPDRGTGIGLFMSKTIVEKSMGGRLTVRNSGGGAEFRIEV